MRLNKYNNIFQKSMTVMFILWALPAVTWPEPMINSSEQR